MRSLIKVKIKAKGTTIYFRKSKFNNRMKALETCIEHLEKIKQHWINVKEGIEALQNAKII